MNFETPGKRALDILDTAEDLKSLAEGKRPAEKRKLLTTSIVLSVMAIEAYTNALIWLKIKDDQRLLEKYTCIEGGERELNHHVGIRTKVKEWTRCLTGKSFGDDALIEKFGDLITLRNKIVHYQTKELDDEQLEEVKESIPYQLEEGGKKVKNQGKIERSIRELFFYDCLATEITPEKTQESIETARGVMAELNKCYYDFIPPWLNNF
ncbi:MAG: hypothetical protein COS84_08770 [Armatimonadetes bacterium CG07_land_8_20_14_0_80_40_9]|nr:MAG: hypothetical protein COS84_08770 [Armatimonadetes bacterium CG07_land_8_20_14_0_80_40_9]